MYTLHKTSEWYSMKNKNWKAISYNVKYIVEAIWVKKSEELLLKYDWEDPKQMLEVFLESVDKWRLEQINENIHKSHEVKRKWQTHQDEIDKHKENSQHLFVYEDYWKTHQKPEWGWWSTRWKFNSWIKVSDKWLTPAWIMSWLNQIRHILRTRWINFRKRHFKDDKNK